MNRLDVAALHVTIRHALYKGDKTELSDLLGPSPFGEPDVKRQNAEQIKQAFMTVFPMQEDSPGAKRKKK